MVLPVSNIDFVGAGLNEQRMPRDQPYPLPQVCRRFAFATAARKWSLRVSGHFGRVVASGEWSLSPRPSLVIALALFGSFAH